MASGAVNGDVVLRVSDLRISFSTYAGEVLGTSACRAGGLPSAASSC